MPAIQVDEAAVARGLALMDGGASAEEAARAVAAEGAGHVSGRTLRRRAAARAASPSPCGQTAALVTDRVGVARLLGEDAEVVPRDGDVDIALDRVVDALLDGPDMGDAHPDDDATAAELAALARRVPRRERWAVRAILRALVAAAPPPKGAP